MISLILIICGALAIGGVMSQVAIGIICIVCACIIEAIYWYKG